MDKKILTVIVIVVVLLATLTIYFLNRIAALEQKTSQLELDLQIVAKKEFQVEQVHTQAIRNLANLAQNARPSVTENSHLSSQIAKPSVLVNNPQPHPAVVRQAPQVTNPESHAKQKKKVTFSADDDEDDEDLLEREFAAQDLDQEDSNRDDESSEIEERPPPKPTISKKAKKPARRGIVSATKAPSERRNSGVMDETRAIAERLRKEAGADVE